MKISVYTDGGSRGNPGISGFGVAIYDESKKVIAEISKFIGIKTNNEAEYMAFIEALYWIESNLEKLAITEVDFYSDSQLLIRQIQGRYKVKAPNIIPLHSVIKNLLSKLEIPCHFHEVLRESNVLADELANRAMDKRS